MLARLCLPENDDARTRVARPIATAQGYNVELMLRAASRVAHDRGADHPDRLSLWRHRAHTLGKHVRIGAVEGVASGLRDDGALIVGGVPILAGEIG